MATKLMAILADKTGVFKFLNLNMPKNKAKNIFNEAEKLHKTTRSANNYITLIYGDEQDGDFNIVKKTDIQCNDFGLYNIKNLITK